ncbi:hypothetical protein PM082_024113 [Marasmius tenuissimus]|nr:hypothetical protein PM082_024113 [Marasmius tenuissimus]
MDSMEPKDFKACFEVVMSIPQCFLEVKVHAISPLHVEETNSQWTLRSTIRVLTVLLHKWKSLQSTLNGSLEVLQAHGRRTFQTPMVESGILQALYYAQECFYIMEQSEHRHDWEECSFITTAAMVLDHITKFIVRHEVLRPFRRVIRQLMLSDWKRLLLGIQSSPPLKRAWTNLHSKGEEIYDICCRLKIEGAMCNYKERTHVALPPGEGLIGKTDTGQSALVSRNLCRVGVNTV